MLDQLTCTAAGTQCRSFREICAEYVFCSTIFSNHIASILLRSFFSYFFKCWKQEQKKGELFFELFYIYHFQLQTVEPDPITRNPLPRAITEFPACTLSMVTISHLDLQSSDLSSAVDKRKRTQHRRYRLQRTVPGTINRGRERISEFLPVVATSSCCSGQTGPL